MYVTYTLDTGAMCNVLPRNVYNLLEKRPKLHKTKVKLSSYGDKTNDLILNLTPENVTQHSGIVTTTHKGAQHPLK